MRLAIAATVLLVADYVVAFGTHFGRHTDFFAVVNGPAGPRWEDVENATEQIVRTIDIGSLVLAVVAIVVLALVRDMPGHALAAFVVIAGSIGTCEVLKPLLGAVDPLGGDSRRLISGSFPSGHSSVAMSVSIALMIAVPPEWRPAAAIVSAAYSACVGVGLVLLGAHYPSDVIAAFLVTCAWAALACGGLARWARLHREADGERASRRVRTGAAVALGVAALVVALFLAVAAAGTDLHNVEIAGRLHTSFLATSAAIVAFAVAIPALISTLLYRDLTRGEPPSGGASSRSRPALRPLRRPRRSAA